MPPSRPDGLSVYFFTATSYENSQAPKRLPPLDRVVVGRTITEALITLADSLSDKGPRPNLCPIYVAVVHEDDAGDLMWEALPSIYVVGIN